MKVEIADMEFDAIINSVSSGKADVGIAGLTVTKDRLKSINFSNSYAKSKQVIIVKAGKEGNKIGIVEKFKKNFIKDNRIVGKHTLELPETVTNIIKCKNPRCITSIEQELPHKFKLTNHEHRIYRCVYCESKFKGN